jgi:hypothetical protein
VTFAEIGEQEQELLPQKIEYCEKHTAIESLADQQHR